MDPDLRASKILTRARRLFKDDQPNVDWPDPISLAHDEHLMRIQARYLQRAEEQLLAEGAIESVDQS